MICAFTSMPGFARSAAKSKLAEAIRYAMSRWDWL